MNIFLIQTDFDKLPFREDLTTRPLANQYYRLRDDPLSVVEALYSRNMLLWMKYSWVVHEVGIMEPLLSEDNCPFCGSPISDERWGGEKISYQCGTLTNDPQPRTTRCLRVWTMKLQERLEAVNRVINVCQEIRPYLHRGLSTGEINNFLSDLEKALDEYDPAGQTFTTPEYEFVEEISEAKFRQIMASCL